MVGGVLREGLAGEAQDLVGTLAARDPAKGRAILGPNATDTHVVAAGNPVVPGILLKEVYLDRVVIDRGGVVRLVFSAQMTSADHVTKALEVLRAASPDAPSAR